MKKWIWLIPLAIGILFPVMFKSQYLLNVGALVLLFAFWATSWNIIGGYAGQMALGNGVYIGLGAYFTGALFKYNNISPWIGMLIAGLICGIIAVLIGFSVFKLKGTYFAISTTALLHVVRMVWQQEKMIFGWDMGGTAGFRIPWKNGLLNMQFLDKAVYFYIVLGLLMLAMLFVAYIERSKTGYYLLAIRGNQEAAASMGVDVRGYKLRAQFMSTFLLAVGGGVYAMLIQFIEVTRVLGYEMSLQVVLYAVIGGRATVWGPTIAALFLYPLNEFVRNQWGSKLAGISPLIYGFLLMIVIYFLPGGLIIYVNRIQHWFREKRGKKGNMIKTTRKRFKQTGKEDE